MKMRWIGMAVALIGVTMLIVPGFSEASDQWATEVIDYTSQWSGGSWAAFQALGVPDTFGYGDISTAWAPAPVNRSLEYLSLRFAKPVYATGATIRETDGNGFVYQVDAIDTDNVLHTVWTGTDPSLPGTPVDFTLTWPTTPYLVQGLKIYVNTDHDPTTWEEIDAVNLSDSTSVPEPISLLFLAPGFIGLAAVRRKFKK